MTLKGIIAEKNRRPPSAREPEISTPLTTLNTGHESIDKVAHQSRQLIEKISTYPVVAHMIRAVERFSDRMGSQFHAAITYFAFLSLIPIMMVSFTGIGFFLHLIQISSPI